MMGSYSLFIVQLSEEFTMKQYVDFDPKQGWPSGANLFYECKKCGGIVSSIKDGECLCGNLYVDASSGRAGASDESQVRMYKQKSATPPDHKPTDR